MATLTTRTGTAVHWVVPPDRWHAARKPLLAEEKKFSQLRDRLHRRRRALPWKTVEKVYVFDGPDEPETLADLVAGKRQLVVCRFMFGPDYGGEVTRRFRADDRPFRLRSPIGGSSCVQGAQLRRAVTDRCLVPEAADARTPKVRLGRRGTPIGADHGRPRGCAARVSKMHAP